MIGVGTDRGGRHLELLGIDALDRRHVRRTRSSWCACRACSRRCSSAARSPARAARCRRCSATRSRSRSRSGSRRAARSRRCSRSGSASRAARRRGRRRARRWSARSARCCVVWRLARIGAQLPPATLILAGVTMSMFCSAASVLIQYTSDFTEVSQMLRWMLGGLDSMQLVDGEVRGAADPRRAWSCSRCTAARSTRSRRGPRSRRRSASRSAGRPASCSSLSVAAGRRGDRGRRADRVRRPDRPARAARDPRPRSPAADPGVGVRRRDPARRCATRSRAR